MPDEAHGVTRVARRTLDSGLELVYQPAPPSSASFSATYIGPAGWAFDPAGAEGTAMAATQLLTSGAGPWDRVAFDRHLDALGATIARRCDPESAEVTVWGPAADWTTLLDTLAQVVLHPRYEAADLDRVRRQLLERQMRQLSQPDSRADLALARALFPKGHPYRESGIGSRPSVVGLQRAHLRAFHRDHFTPDGALLVVTGRVGMDRTAREAGRRLVDWSGRPSPRPPDVGPPRRTTSEPQRISMPGTAQVELRVGGESIARGSPAFPAAFLANEVLGGRPLLCRLFQVVREEHGLAYHASSEVEAMRWGGTWTAAAGTGPERIDATLDLLRREVRRMADESVPDRELGLIRESTIGELPLSLETTSGAHELACDIAYHHLPDDFLAQWPATLRAVTPSQLRDAARAAMDERRAAVVVAGPPPSP